MTLFLCLAQFSGAVQVWVLSVFSRPVRWRMLLFAFVAGMSASVALALLLEFTWPGARWWA